MSTAAVIVSFVATYTAQTVIEKIFDGSNEEATLRKKIRAVFDRIIPDIIERISDIIGLISNIIRPPLYAIFWQNLPYVVLLAHIGINLRIVPPGKEEALFVVGMTVVLLFRTFTAQCCKFLRQQVCPAHEQQLRWLEKTLIVRFQIGDAHFWIYSNYVCSFTNQGKPLPSPSDNTLEFVRHLVQKTPLPDFPPEIQLSQKYSKWKELAKQQGIYDDYQAWLRKCAEMPPKLVGDTPSTKDAAIEDARATTSSAPEAGNPAQLGNPSKGCEALGGLLCSLTGDLITYPVKDRYARNYEHREILKWLEEKEKKYPPECLAEMDPNDRETALLQFCPQNIYPITRNTLEYDFDYPSKLVWALRPLANSVPLQFREGLLSYVEGVFEDQQSRSQKSLEGKKKLYNRGRINAVAFLRAQEDSLGRYYVRHLGQLIAELKERFNPA